MSSNTDKKLGDHTPNLAYDLPELLMLIRKHIRITDLESLPYHIKRAQELLDIVKMDIETHLLLLGNEIEQAKERMNR